jgi:hypothetical protein
MARPAPSSSSVRRSNNARPNKKSPIRFTEELHQTWFDH